MRTRTIAAFVAGVLCGGIAVASLLRPGGSVSASETAPGEGGVSRVAVADEPPMPVPSEYVEERRARSAAATRAIASAARAPQSPFMADVAGLQRRFPWFLQQALGGDIEAVKEIRWSLEPCSSAPTSEGRFAYMLSRIEGTGPERERKARQLAELYTGCRALTQAIDPLDRLELARLHADAGDPGARREYIYQAPGLIDDSPTPELDQRYYRMNAQRFMREDFERGDIDALWLYAHALEKGTAFERDRMRAAAYHDAVARLGGDNPWIARASFNRLTERYTVDELAQVHRMADEILQAFPNKSVMSDAEARAQCSDVIRIPDSSKPDEREVRTICAARP